jgi:hypothetical protein
VEPSLKVPVTENLRAAPILIVGLTGVTVRETSVAVVTVRVVEAEREPDVPVMMVLPGLALEARPPAGVILATVVTEELQLALRSRVLPSSNKPVAVNCCAVVRAIEESVGLIEIPTRDAGVTVRTVDWETDPKVAVIVVVPGPTLTARPVLLITPTLGAEEFQLTESVMFCVLPSENVPEAKNCSVTPAGKEG